MNIEINICLFNDWSIHWQTSLPLQRVNKNHSKRKVTHLCWVYPADSVPPLPVPPGRWTHYWLQTAGSWTLGREAWVGGSPGGSSPVVSVERVSLQLGGWPESHSRQPQTRRCFPRRSSSGWRPRPSKKKKKKRDRCEVGIFWTRPRNTCATKGLPVFSGQRTLNIAKESQFWTVIILLRTSVKFSN